MAKNRTLGLQFVSSIFSYRRKIENSMDTEHPSDVCKPVFYKILSFLDIQFGRKKVHKLKAPCKVVITLRKTKTVLPSLKPPVDKLLRSGVVYKTQCKAVKHAMSVKLPDISQKNLRT